MTRDAPRVPTLVGLLRAVARRRRAAERFPRAVAVSFALYLSLFSATASAEQLFAPLGLNWGQSPTDAERALLAKGFTVSTNQPMVAAPESFLDERRYQGDVLGIPADHVAPMFFASQLFGVAASFSPTPDRPATAIWDATVAKLTASYGKPASKTKPVQLLTWNAVLALLPPEVDRNALLAFYAQAAANPELARAIMYDLEVQVGLWVPEAIWRFNNGSVVKAVMRAGGSGPYGLKALKPAVLYLRYEQLK